MGCCNLERLDIFMNRLAAAWWTAPQVVLKVVVDPDNDDDYEFARMVLCSYDADQLYMSVLTKRDDTREDILERYRRLAERVCGDRNSVDIAVLPQLHVLLWGHRRGV
jgi:organic radical activating enzyme